MLKPASERITRARTRLLLDAPFYGALLMRLRIVESTCDRCPTMQTDGTTLEYSAAFVDTLSDAELTGVMTHEVGHCALRHMYRVNGRDMSEWNEACDFVINADLVKHGFSLPAGALLDPAFDGMSAEQVFAKRRGGKQKQGGQPQPGGNKGQQTGSGQPIPGSGKPSPSGQQTPANAPGTPAPCPTGTFTAPPQPAPSNGQDTPAEVMTEHDWEIATEQAIAVAKKAGKLPGGIDRAVRASRETIEDWRAILREFIEQTVPSDYSWTQPNRRYIGAGVYLPGTVKENMPRLAVAIDTSGSIDVTALNMFAVELTAILHDARPESIEVIYCDARVNGTQSFTPDDAEIKLTPIGGGGTRFTPVFDHVSTWDEQPAALIYFTDLDCYDTPVEPDYPTLWVTNEWTRRTAPFGRTVRLSQWA